MLSQSPLHPRSLSLWSLVSLCVSLADVTQGLHIELQPHPAEINDRNSEWNTATRGGAIKWSSFRFGSAEKESDVEMPSGLGFRRVVLHYKSRKWRANHSEGDYGLRGTLSLSLYVLPGRTRLVSTSHVSGIVYLRDKLIVQSSKREWEETVNGRLSAELAWNIWQSRVEFGVLFASPPDRGALITACIIGTVSAFTHRWIEPRYRGG